MLNRDLSLLKALEAKGIDVFYLKEWAEVWKLGLGVGQVRYVRLLATND